MERILLLGRLGDDEQASPGNVFPCADARLKDYLSWPVVDSGEQAGIGLGFACIQVNKGAGGTVRFQGLVVKDLRDNKGGNPSVAVDQVDLLPWLEQTEAFPCQVIVCQQADRAMVGGQAKLGHDVLPWGNKFLHPSRLLDNGSGKDAGDVDPAQFASLPILDLADKGIHTRQALIVEIVGHSLNPPAGDIDQDGHKDECEDKKCSIESERHSTFPGASDDSEHEMRRSVISAGCLYQRYGRRSMALRNALVRVVLLILIIGAGDRSGHQTPLFSIYRIVRSR